MQKRCYVNGCFLNNSSNTHAHYLLTKIILHNFISLQAFTVYMDNSLQFEIWPKWNLHQSVSFTSPELMWILMMKLLYTDVKFYPNGNLKPVWDHFRSHVNVSLHQSEILPRREILIRFKFTSCLMSTCS